MTLEQAYNMRTGRSDFGMYSPQPPEKELDSEVPIHGVKDQPFADAATVSTNLRSSIRILVIDDDRTLREGCASLLQVEGYSVTVSGRGDEATGTVGAGCRQ